MVKITFLLLLIVLKNNMPNDKLDINYDIIGVDESILYYRISNFN